MTENGHDLAMRLQYRETPVDDAVPRRNRQAVLDVFDRIKAGDFGALWTLFDDDVVFYEASSLPYGGVFRGLEATQQAFARLADFYSHMDTVVEAISAAEDMVFVYETVKYTVRANGNTGTNLVSEMFRFRDEKVVEWRAFYFDAALVTQTLTGDKRGD